MPPPRRHRTVQRRTVASVGKLAQISQRVSCSELLHRRTRKRENNQGPREDSRNSHPSNGPTTDKDRTRRRNPTYKRTQFEDEDGHKEAPFDLDHPVANQPSLFVERKQQRANLHRGSYRSSPTSAVTRYSSRNTHFHTTRHTRRS